MSDQTFTAAQITQKTEQAIKLHAQAAKTDPGPMSIKDHQRWYWLKAHGVLTLWTLMTPWSPEKELEQMRLEAMANEIYPVMKTS